MENYFPTPNSHVDDAMHLLTSDEYKVLSFIVRHILGWKERREERMACISITMLCKGYTARKTGTVYHGTGLSRPTVTKILAKLVDYGLIDPVGDPTPQGQIWYLPNRTTLPDALVQRQQESQAKAGQRMAHARSKRDELVNDINHQAVNAVNQRGKRRLLKQINEQTNQQTKVVVVGTAHESGESVVAGEGPQPKIDALRDGSVDRLEAGPPPIPPVPQPPLAPDEALIKSLGTKRVSRKVALWLIEQYGQARVRKVWEYVLDNLATLNRPVAFLRSELKDPRYVPLADAAPETQTDVPQPLAGQDDWHAQRLAELQAREHIAPLPAPVGLDDKLSGSSMTPREVWTTAHHQLSLLFDRSSFDMWLKTATLMSQVDGTYTIGVPTAHAQGMLQHRYYRKVQRVVEGLQNSPVTLRFEVRKEAPLDQQPLTDSERAELVQLRADMRV